MVGWVLLSLAPLAASPEAERQKVKVLRRLRHDAGAFTQGLLLDENGGSPRFIESTGLYGRSTLREVDLESGAVLRGVDLPGGHFGEGLALWGGRLIQLTWREGIAHVYDRGSFEKREEFRYEGEGWGLCSDGRRLVMSDGSSRLQFRSPETFEPLSSVEVLLDGEPQPLLNELEYAGGFIYANVWTRDIILKIDPQSGIAAAVIDASGLLSPAEKLQADVLNGIAYSERRGSFFLTGKLWPAVFEVVFLPLSGDPPALFRRGDCDGNGSLHLTDAIFHLESLFLGGDRPGCAEACDSNADSRSDISDPLHLLSHLFLGGPALPEPSGACGPDPNPSAGLGCARSPCE